MEGIPHNGGYFEQYGTEKMRKMLDSYFSIECSLCHVLGYVGKKMSPKPGGEQQVGEILGELSL